MFSTLVCEEKLAFRKISNFDYLMHLNTLAGPSGGSSVESSELGSRESSGDFGRKPLCFSSARSHLQRPHAISCVSLGAFQLPQ